MNETLQTLQSLHSTHGNFEDRAIPESDLQTILETCMQAANVSNKQSYSIVVVRDKERMQALTPYVGSAALIFCVDFNRLEKTAERLGQTYQVQRLMPFVTAYTDTCLAAQSAVVAAASLGVDSLLTNGIHRGDIDRIYRVLELPEKGCFPVIELVLGYADAPHVTKRGRLLSEGVVHHETYQGLSDEAADRVIAAYDDPDRNLALGTNWEETHEHFLGWFFEVWMQRAPVQEGPSQLFKRLLQGGFLDQEK